MMENVKIMNVNVYLFNFEFLSVFFVRVFGGGGGKGKALNYFTFFLHESQRRKFSKFIQFE